MLKAEELKILEQIEKLIDNAGADSYIRMTFAGVPEICRRNIEDDFADCPVKDLDQLREKCYAENKAHGEILLKLEHERDILRQEVENKDANIATLNHLLESMRKTADEWEQNAHEAGEMYCDLEKEIEAQNAEIIRLRAEIVRMRMQIMPEDKIAELYEKTEGV